MSDAPKRPRRWFKTIVRIAVVLLLLGGGSAGGYWWWQRNGAAQAASAAGTDAGSTGDEHHAAPIDNHGALIAFDPFLVNLSGNGGTQFLRIKVQLVVADEEHAKEFEEQPVAIMRVRSAILEVLAEQKGDVLVTADGKTALKKTLQERASTILGVPILDVLFSDFVVQF